MATDDGVTISRQVSLTPDELAEVIALKDVCDALESLDLKLGYGAAEPETARYPAVLLARAAGQLVGYCSLDGDDAVAEMCGMVRPEWRRRRLGFRLFDAARAGFSGAGGQQIFAVCEEGAASGRAFLRMLAAQRAFSEHRMQLRQAPSAAQTAHSQSETLTIARARTEDYRPLAAALARAFDNTEERLLGDLTSASAIATEQVYVARLGGAIIGGFRLSVMPDSTGIYAFGIDRGYRRQGRGRQMLAQACALATEQGARRITLEVDTDNTAAIALYRSSGFEVTTTYGYYIFSPTLLAVGLDLDDASDEASDA
ncbi:MAG TPA: GNAT family N-acetyltransferase [Ktedonobacterales bacterium]|nr:GNAT family N-acetyltransferase [Ktedonobacterales bacterium]